MASEKERIEIVLWESLEESYTGPQTSEAFINRTWEALRRAGDKRIKSLAYLLHRFLQHENNDLRLQALTSLCLVGDKEGIALAADLAFDPLCDPSDRARSLEALLLSREVSLPDKEALLQMARDSSSPEILKTAAEIAYLKANL